MTNLRMKTNNKHKKRAPTKGDPYVFNVLDKNVRSPLGLELFFEIAVSFHYVMPTYVATRATQPTYNPSYNPHTTHL